MGHELTACTEGRIGGDGAVVHQLLCERAEAWELPRRDEKGSLAISIWRSEVILHPLMTGARIEVRSPEERLMRTLQDSLAELMGENGLSIEWDHVAAGALAPGLSLMRVAGIRQRTPGFVRVRVTGPEAARFATGGFHFRLLLGPEGRAPVWPRISDTGRTIWPSGEDSLHRPVYTTVATGPDWLEFDIFRHAGSPTCDWVDRNPIGETVGLIGPGGGACPEGSSLVLFGDETALPAIGRMLALAEGEVRACLQVGEEDLGELARDPRIRRVTDLGVALAGADLSGASHVWFAGHSEQARKARADLLARGLDKRSFTAVAYWG